VRKIRHSFAISNGIFASIFDRLRQSRSMCRIIQ
jgi:hypothetical protein